MAEQIEMSDGISAQERGIIIAPENKPAPLGIRPTPHEAIPGLNPDRLGETKNVLALPVRSPESGLVEEPRYQAADYDPKMKYTRTSIYDGDLVHELEFDSNDQLVKRITRERFSAEEAEEQGLNFTTELPIGISRDPNKKYLERYVNIDGKKALFIIEADTRKPVARVPEIAGGQESLIRLTPGLDEAGFREEVEERLEDAERSSEFRRSFEIVRVIESFRTAINNYDRIPGVPRIDRDIKDELTKKVELRAALDYAAEALRERHYKEYAGIMGLAYFDGAHLDVLWDEELRTGEKVIQILTKIKEEADPVGPGAYYREAPRRNNLGQTEIDRVTKDVLYPPGSKHELIRRILTGGTITAAESTRYGIPQNIDQDKKNRWRVADKITDDLATVMLWDTYCVGPLYPGQQRLMYEVVFDHIDNSLVYPNGHKKSGQKIPPEDESSSETFGFKRYQTNTNFWERVRNVRYQENQRIDPKTRTKIYKGLTLASSVGSKLLIDSPGSKLLDPPEDFVKSRKGKATGLKYATTGYGLTYVHQNGFRMLSDLMNYRHGEGVDKPVINFYFANSAQGVSEILKIMEMLLNNPLPVLRQSYDRERNEIEEVIKPSLLQVQEKFSAYIPLFQDMRFWYYVNFRIMVDVLNYMRDKSDPVRVTEFYTSRAPGPDTSMQIIHHPSISIDTSLELEAAKLVGVTERNAAWSRHKFAAIRGLPATVDIIKRIAIEKHD